MELRSKRFTRVFYADVLRKRAQSRHGYREITFVLRHQRACGRAPDTLFHCPAAIGVEKVMRRDACRRSEGPKW